MGVNNPPAEVSQNFVQSACAVKTDTALITSNTFADITGLSVTLTPRNSSSKFLVIVDLKLSDDVSGAPMFKVLRNGSDVYVGDEAGSRVRVGAHSSVDWRINTDRAQACMIFVDEPATASPVTYKVQWRGQTANSVYLNRSGLDADNSSESARDASSITVLELGA